MHIMASTYWLINVPIFWSVTSSPTNTLNWSMPMGGQLLVLLIVLASALSPVRAGPVSGFFLGFSRSTDASHRTAQRRIRTEQPAICCHALSLDGRPFSRLSEGACASLTTYTYAVWRVCVCVCVCVCVFVSLFVRMRGEKAKSGGTC